MDLKSIAETTEENKPRLKKNNIWSDTLIETNLCDDVCSKFSSFDDPEPEKLDNFVIKQDRCIESYDFTKRPVKTSPGSQSKKNHLSLIDCNQAKQSNFVKNNNINERIGPLVQFDENKSRAHIIANEFDSNELVTKEIVKHLNEPKSELIERVVNVLGKKKALELLYATEDIQSNGGMLTTEGNRYRTAGGVYIQLLRKDDQILNCQRKKIFIEDLERKKRQKNAKRLQQRKRFDLAKEKLKEKVRLEGKNKQKEEYDDQDELNDVNEDEMIYFDE